jgi:hypothetical protein
VGPERWGTSKTYRLRKAEGRRRKAEGGRQKAVGRREKAEGRRRKAEGSRQKAEGRRQKAEGRRQKAEVGPEIFSGGCLRLSSDLSCELTRRVLLLPSAFCLLPSAYCLLPSAFRLLSALPAHHPVSSNSTRVLNLSIPFINKSGPIEHQFGVPPSGG